jgi:hypothetical protein
MRSGSRSAAAKRPKQCLFCGMGGKLTKEHINPRWLHPYLGRRFTHTGHSVGIRTLDVSKGEMEPYRFSRGKLQRPGDPHSQTLRILCARCNNVRLGALQERAKRYLLPLVVGVWPDLDAEGQHVVAAWAAMNTMIREAADPPTAATSKEGRREFLMNLEAPPTWSVWIGRCSDIQSGVWNHVGWKERQDLPLHPFVNKDVCRQTTGFVMGQLFILTMSAPDNVGDSRQAFGEQFARQYDLSLIWPTMSRVTMPQTVYDYRGWNLVAREIPRRRGIAVRIVGDAVYGDGS